MRKQLCIESRTNQKNEDPERVEKSWNHKILNDGIFLNLII